MRLIVWQIISRVNGSATRRDGLIGRHLELGKWATAQGTVVSIYWELQSLCTCGSSASDDTVERLAARMATPDRNLERFRILNAVKAGDRVKLVVE
jgi:hypothetical protein